MRQAGWALIALVALVAAPTHAQDALPAASWTQRGGDAGHGGVALVGDAPVDVVASYSWSTGPAEFLNGGGAGFVATPAGPTALVESQVDATTIVCQLLRITDVETGAAQRIGPTIACNDGARMLAYDAARDALIIEIDGLASDPIVQSWDARTGEQRWGTGPGVLAPEVPGARDQFDWFVLDGVVDAESSTLYTIFAGENTGRHRVAAIALENGTLLWSSTIPASFFLAGSTNPGAPEPAWDLVEQASSSTQAFVPESIVKTTSGIVVRGQFATQALAQPALAWLDLEGRPVGAYFGANGDVRTADANLVYSDLVALGSQAAALLSGQLVIIDPVSTAPELIELPERAYGFAASPAWSREALVVPLGSSAVIYPAGERVAARIWSGYEGSRIEQVFLSPPGDAYALVSRPTLDGLSFALLRIDLATARTIDRLPISMGNATAAEPRVLPLGSGRLLAFTFEGHAALLAPAPEPLRPRLRVDNAYPALGEEFELVPTVSADLRELTVAWGDGVLDAARSGAPATHAYNDLAGRRVVRVVAVYPDNRTGTAEAILYVGMPPPRELTAIQRAFEPEFQNYTLFLLGLAATGAGAAFAYRQRLRRKTRLQTDLEELDALRALGKTETVAAVQRLGAYRARIKRDLAEGALDDAQYTALSGEAMRLLASLRLRMLGGLQGKLSPAFQHLLDTTLDDGIVTAEEVAALREALARETALGDADRARLAQLVEGWQERS